MSQAQEAYDRWHASHAVDEQSDAPWHRMLKPALVGLRGQRVLEIACGRGGFAVWLASLPPELRPEKVVASDFSAVALDKAKEFGRSKGVSDRIEYVRGDLNNLAWGDAEFDAVISCETIEHTPDPRVAVQELARVLKPGGYAYLTFPNYLGLLGLFRLYREATGRPYTEEGQPINHTLLLPKVLGWIKNAGLEVTHLEGVGHYLPIPGRPQRRLELMDKVPLAHWIAAHAFVVARRVQRAG